MGGGCNDAPAGPGSQPAPLSAAEVGGSFVLQYYRTLTTDRENLHKYYKDESICSRGFEGASPDQITYGHGVDEIREDIRSASPTLGASKCEINGIQSQESKQGGILVLVLGYFSYSDSPQKVHFTQVFFLDKQTDPYPGYFVQNDILRYVTGKPEQSEMQAQTDLPPPRLPPPQPPIIRAPVVAAAPPCAVVEPSPVEEEEVEEEEEPYQEVVEEEADNDEEELDINYSGDAAAADDLAAAEAVAAAAEAAEAEEKPATSWACMASKLKEGGGQLGSSKVQGFALPAPAKAKALGSLPSSSPSKFNAASSTTPVLPPPSSVAKAKAKAATAEDAGDVRLWLSRLPMEPAVENQELLECLNKLILDAGMQGQAEIDSRRDMTKDWAYVTVSSPDLADLLAQNSKDRKVSVRGKILKIDAEKQKSTQNRQRTGKGGGADDGADGRRGKGGKGGGGKGGKGGADTGSPADKRGGKEGRRGGEKGGGGNWRAAA